MSAAAATERAPHTSPGAHRVVVLGAGMSGVCAGIKLREQGMRDFVILEKAGAVTARASH